MALALVYHISYRFFYLHKSHTAELRQVLLMRKALKMSSGIKYIPKSQGLRRVGYVLGEKIYDVGGVLSVVLG